MVPVAHVGEPTGRVHAGRYLAFLEGTADVERAGTEEVAGSSAFDTGSIEPPPPELVVDATQQTKDAIGE